MRSRYLRLHRVLVATVLLGAVVGCDEDGKVDARDAEAPDGGAYTWDLPPWFPEPVVPDDNPMSIAKVELGRHLFYDGGLSANRSQSCAACHQQARAFSDGLVTAVGSTFQMHPRNSQGLTNVAYNATLTWGNPRLLLLEEQALIPIFGTEPVELGLHGLEELLIERLRNTSRHQALFPKAFDDTDPFTVDNVVKALAAFQRTLIAGRSAYVRFVHEGDSDAISESAKRGSALFDSERLGCSQCHDGVLLADSVHYVGNVEPELRFHNTGLYNIDGQGAYPAPNTGVHELTSLSADMGRFRAPSLRNVALTAPYMHDGSIATLSEVIDHYAAGGRTISDGPFAGDGSQSPLKSDLITGFTLDAQERADLIAFLDSLTDDAFIQDERFANPWPLPCALCTND